MVGLLLISELLAGCAMSQTVAGGQGAWKYGGSLIFNEFAVDSERHAVISPPTGAQPGDLLWIYPLRLNDDEYLILQKCRPPNCEESQVVRAWNSGGYMGPYPVLSVTVPIEAGWTYILWMQRIAIAGGGTFSLYERDSRPLVFVPAGSHQKFFAADLKSATEQGPSPIVRSAKEASTFVATFKGGSVVRMQMLRTNSGASTP
jgi:hypothetical protein